MFWTALLTWSIYKSVLAFNTFALSTIMLESVELFQARIRLRVSRVSLLKRQIILALDKPKNKTTDVNTKK